MSDVRQLAARWRRPLAAVAVGALLGVTGPFGSQNAFSPAVKYGLWMVLALTGFGAIAAAERILPSAAPPKSFRRVLAVGAASAIPMTFFVAWAFSVVQPGRTFSPLQMITLYPFVALVQVMIARVTASDGEVSAAPGQDPSEVVPDYPAQLLAKLPPPLRQGILALEAEDHYVRVHTRQGSALILMRLADAEAQIDSRLGLRVHRSWWVAKDAIDTLEGSAGQMSARLVNGTTLPISRTYASAARAGFVKDRLGV